MGTIRFLKARPVLVQGLAFGIFYFVYLLTETAVSYHAGNLFFGDAVTAVFSAKMAFAGIGYLLFALTRRKCSREQMKRLMVVAGAGAVLGAIGLTAFDLATAFLLCALTGMLSLGFIGGFIYYTMSQTFWIRDGLGRTVGVSAALATALHFLIQNPLYSDVVFLLSVGFGVAALLLFVLHPPHSWVFAEPLPAQKEAEPDRKKTAALLVAIVLLTMLFRVNDQLALSFYSSLKEGANGPGSAQLLLLPALVLAGFAADYRSKRLLNVLLACSLFLYTAASTILVSGQFLSADLALMYFCGAFYVVFIIVVPIRIAMESGRPEWWSGFGRIVRNLTIGATMLPMTFAYRALGQRFLVTGNAVIAFAALLLMYAAGLMESGDSAKQESADEIREQFIERYGLTPVEWEICERYIFTEDTISGIADHVHLSKRTVERHIASVQEKTGTHSRVGIVRLYFQRS